jgi:hypothetical protein
VKARIQRLRAEIASDRVAFEQRLDELAPLILTADAPAGDLARAAVALHHAYSAVEGALSRIARVLGEGIPEGRDWLQDLLRAVSLEVEAVRPAVLSPPSTALLQPLLAFRHFFRHGYAVSLDGVRLAALRADALALRASLGGDPDRFDDFLRDVARSARD